MMRQVLPLLMFGVAAIANSVQAQELGDFICNQPTFTVARAWHARWSDFNRLFSDEPVSAEVDAFGLAIPCSNERRLSDRFVSSSHGYIVRGQDEGVYSDEDEYSDVHEGDFSRGDGDVGEGDLGAGSAVDPSVPLIQMQFQNVFVPSTHDASGYSNQFILQPVLPIFLNSEFFPYKIVRATLPIPAPTADPDGPQSVQGGLSDFSIIGAFSHPMPHLKTTWGVGYFGVFPTATHPQLGTGEWQLGPSAYFVTRAVPKWVIGAIYQQPFSLESNAYSVMVQPIATRLLPNDWYVGWGDFLWTLDNQNGNYDLPLSIRLGKVVEVGRQPLNIFVQPFYTPDGLRNGPASEWGVKLSVTLLFPKAKIGPLFGSDCCRHHR